MNDVPAQTDTKCPTRLVSLNGRANLGLSLSAAQLRRSSDVFRIEVFPRRLGRAKNSFERWRIV
jgi:hypothetical protein